MKPATLGLALLTALAPAHPPRLTAAQPKAPSAAAKKADAELAAAKKQVTEAQHKLNDIQQEIRKAETAHQTAVTKIQRERQKATQEHGSKLGLQTALAERDTLHRQTSAIFDSAVTTIKGSSEYKSTAAAASKASDELKLVREDTTLAEDRKSRRTSELSAIIRGPAELQRQQLDRDPRLIEARQREGEASQKVAQIQPRVTKAVEADPEVVAALRHERETAEQLTKAREKLSRAQKDLAAAQAELAREARQNAQQDKKDDKKPKKK